MLDQWVSSVRLPGAAGELEVLGFHVPFVAALTLGRVWIEGPPLRVWPIRSGLAWLASDRLMIIAEELIPKGAR